MNDLIKELREWFDKPWSLDTDEEFEDILSRHEKDTEPLAVLADRKGWDTKSYRSSCGWHCEIWREPFKTLDEAIIGGPTYYKYTESEFLLAEAKARAYLEGLDDVKGGAVT